MQVHSYKTKRFSPPRDDIFPEMFRVLPALSEGTILVVASKIVAIHEGNCVLVKTPKERKALIEAESEQIIKTSAKNGWDLTVKNDMVTFVGGIDESNAGGYTVLLPKDPTRSAFLIRQRLAAHYGIAKLGVIITDSSGLPYRQGVIGLSIGHAGFEPVKNFIGRPDLFGRPFQYTYVNVVDALAVAGSYVMGETDECTPLAIITDAPGVAFTDHDTRATLRVPPEEDVFYAVLKGTYT